MRQGSTPDESAGIDPLGLDDEPIHEPFESTPWLPVLRDPAIGHPTLLVGATAALLAFWANQGAGVAMALALGCCAFLVVLLAVIDIKTTRLPDPLVLAVFLVGLFGGLAAVEMGDLGWDAVLRGLLCAAACWAFQTVAAVLTGGIGFGDVKLAAALGMVFGMEGHYVAWTSLLAPYPLAMIGAGLLMCFFRGIKGLPMGPFIGAVALFLLFAPGVAEHVLTGGLSQ